MVPGPLLQPVAGRKIASTRVKRPAERMMDLPIRRLRDAKSMMRPAIARVEERIQRERLPVRLRPLVATRDVVVKATFCVTAEVVRAKDAGGVQVTPAGAVPEDVQVSVTVPVKVLVGVKTRLTLPTVPARRVIVVEVFPLTSARVKSGAGEPVPVRAEERAVADALVTTLSWPVADPTAVGVKTTLMAQVAPMARLVPQLLLAEKAPVVAMLVTVSAASPVLVRVKATPLEGLPTMVVGKVVLGGVRVAESAGAGMVK